MLGSSLETALVLAACLAAVGASLCRPGHSWWDPQAEVCINCTRCDSIRKALVVLRPCQIHQDTVCAPLKDLDIDWSWLKPIRHKKHHQKHDNVNKNKQIIWKFATVSNEEARELMERNLPMLSQGVEVTEKRDEDSHKKNEIDESLEYVDEDDNVEVRLEPEPLYSGEEEVVWDWQTVILTLAVCACVVFFIVVALYTVHHAKQWKLLKENLEADVEGLSTKLSLMMSAVSEGQEQRSEQEEAPASSCPGSDTHYTNLQCAYLEQLLAGKVKGRALGPANVYTQENNI